jgi:alkanesulfonate monooxygenase
MENERGMTPQLELFTTCPPSAGPISVEAGSSASYRTKVEAVARWSEAAGCRGILVYTDNRLVDPWLVSQLNSTRKLRVPTDSPSMKTSTL